MKTPACFIAFVFTLAACVLAFSAESGAPPAPPSDPPKGGAAEPPRAPAPEQPAAGDPAKDDKANPPKKDEKKPQKKGPGIIVSPGGKMSPVDIALFSIAQIYLQKDDVKSALAALERTAANSPDRDSRGAAYFSMANIYLHRLNDPDKALSCLMKVEGKLGEQAKNRIIAIVSRGKSYEEAVAILEKLAAGAADKNHEAAIRLALALLHQKKGNLDAALAELEKVAAMDYKGLELQDTEPPKEPQKEKPAKPPVEKPKPEKL